MSKLQQIVTISWIRKTRRRCRIWPLTINYLTGFYSDPHERQMFLFVLADQEPLLFVPALEVERASSTVSFPVVGYVDSENPWQKWNMLFHNLTSNVSLLSLTISSWPNIMAWNSLWNCWVWKPHSSYPRIAPHQISWRSAKNDGCRALCW